MTDNRAVDMAAQELLTRVLAGDSDGIVVVLRSMRESERRACASTIVSARDPRSPQEVSDAQALAEFGVLPPSKIRRLSMAPVRWHASTDDPRFEEILRLRPRPWRDRLLRRATWRLGLPWPVAYRLVRDGLADSPNTPWYYAAGARHVEQWRDDPDWLSGPFWELFTCEEVGIELSGGSPETYRELADTGRVPRARLLNASLDALSRDFAPRATRFYRALFQALAPTADELYLMSGGLLALLAADNQLDVGVALSSLTVLQDERRLDSEELLLCLRPALGAPTKKHALAAVKLVATVLETEPALTSVAVETLTESLFHRRSDIQRAAFGLVEPHLHLLEPATLRLLFDAHYDLDPLILAALRSHGQGVRPSATTAGSPDSRLPAVRMPESPEPPRQTTEPFTFGPVSPPRSAHDPRYMAHFCGWDGDVDLGYGEALLARVSDMRVPDGLREPLSNPTHPGGWIEPTEAARRLWYLEGRALSWDFAMMILRLAPDTDGAARAALEHLDSEDAAILRYALGDDIKRSASLSALEPGWAAAVAVRDPAAYENRARPDAAQALEQAKRRAVVTGGEPQPLPADPMSVLEGYKVPPMHMLPWLATIWPANREPFFRMIVRWLWRLRPDGRVPEIEPSLALLTDPRASAGPEAGLAFAVCLSSKDVGLRSFAAMTIATAITRGAVTGAWLGVGLSRALLEYRGVEVHLPDNQTAGAVPRRWVDPLDDIARNSPQHGLAVHVALETLIASDPAQDRPRLTSVLSLLRTLTLKHARPISDLNARRFLAGFSPRSQGGEIARELLAFSTDAPPGASARNSLP